MIDIRLSERARDQLIRLKRYTGVKTWNVLCRWAFCLSLSNPEPVEDKFDSTEGAIEIRWDVFGGEWQDIYYALLIQRGKIENVEISDRGLSKLARQHIHRGIGIMANRDKVNSLKSLLMLAVD